MTLPDRLTPWRRVDAAAVFVGNLAGLATLIAAYAGASHESAANRQIGWVDLGVAGLLVVAVADSAWLLAGRRACWHWRHALLAPGGDGRPSATTSVHDPAATDHATLVASEAMSWYHSPSCQMVIGKTITPASRSEHEAAGRRPCGLCRPAVQSPQRAEPTAATSP